MPGLGAAVGPDGSQRVRRRLPREVLIRGLMHFHEVRRGPQFHGRFGQLARGMRAIPSSFPFPSKFAKDRSARPTPRRRLYLARAGQLRLRLRLVGDRAEQQELSLQTMQL